jgi:hypothetical protein
VVGDLLGGSLMMIGAVMLALRRSIAASSPTGRRNLPGDALRQNLRPNLLGQAAAQRTLIAGLLSVLGGAALIVIATVS